MCMHDLHRTHDMGTHVMQENKNGQQSKCAHEVTFTFFKETRFIPINYRNKSRTWAIKLGDTNYK